jgi:hypothetical protein
MNCVDGIAWDIALHYGLAKTKEQIFFSVLLLQQGVLLKGHSVFETTRKISFIKSRVLLRVFCANIILSQISVDNTA